MGAGAVHRRTVGRVAAGRISYRRLFTLATAMGISILVASVMPTLATEAVALVVMGATTFGFIAVANTTIQLTSRARDARAA